MNISDYVARLLAAYTSLPDTRDRPSRSDRALARSLYRQGVTLAEVEHAMILASVRRHYRGPDLTPLEPIHSLHYFLPVIRQLAAEPLHEVYVEHLKSKLNEIPNRKTTDL